ncbi:hypothetical protein BGZ76_009105 [Entomortierella beljakovae]|nr:hypothetical protein BGZ76_009105 [Entomortierella beljakovae]
MLRHPSSSTKLLVSYSPSRPKLSIRGKHFRHLLNISLRREHGPFQEFATAATWINSRKGAVPMISPLNQSALNNKQVAALSTASFPLPLINPASNIDATWASIAPVVSSRGASTMSSLKPLEEQDEPDNNDKGTFKKAKEFKELSAFTYFPKSPKLSLSPSLPDLSQSDGLKFTPPPNTISDPPDSMPYIDFRTNGSRTVYYTKDEAQANIWLKSIDACATRMWALDAEWKPYDFNTGTQGKLALIQLGNDKTVYLFHVFHMQKFPSVLSKILEDRDVLKVGINIRNDGTKIMKDWGVGCANLVELGVLSVQVQDNLESTRKIRSMDTLSRELLGHTVRKTESLQMGNWQRKNLDHSLLAYAANDVFVTYEVAERIKHLQKYRPPQDYMLELTTILNNGAEVIKVHGTLQQREDDTKLTKDIIIHATRDEKRSKTMPPKSSPKLSGSAQSAPVTSISNTKIKMQPPTKTTVKPAQKVSQGNRINDEFWIPNWNSVTMMKGNRTTVTIIPAKNLKRAYSTRRLRSSDDTAGSTSHANDLPDGVIVSANMLPESMDMMDITERNQTIWLRAGGRDISEDVDLQTSENDDDWYLKQNQALFQSISSPTDTISIPEGDEQSRK